MATVLCQIKSEKSRFYCAKNCIGNTTIWFDCLLPVLQSRSSGGAAELQALRGGLSANTLPPAAFRQQPAFVPGALVV